MASDAGDVGSVGGVGGSWLTSNVKVLSGVSFLQDAASELLYPVLPLFLTVTLGAPVAVVGLVEGAAEGAAALTKLVAGRISDRRARRPLIGLGYGLAAVGKLLVAVAFAWPVVLAGRVVDRLGKGIRGAPRDALLVVDVPVSARGRVFGVHRAADTAGAVVGPLIGLALFELLHHRFRPLLVVAVVPAVLSVLLVRAVREPSAPSTSSVVRPSAATRPELSSRVPLPSRLRALVALLTVFGLVNFPDALLLLRAHEVGLGTAGVIGAYVIYNAAYAALSYPAGALSDRLPRHRVFAAGLVFFAMGYLGLAAVTSPGLVFVVLPLYGGFAACTDGVGKAWVSALAPPSVQGYAQGTYQALTGGAIIVAGVWAGLAWSGDGRLPLVVSGVVALVVASVLVVAGPRLSASPSPSPVASPT
jgi:MFS family permease